MQEGEQTVWTTMDVARYLRISIRKLNDIIKAGKLPYSRIGDGRGALRFRKADVDAYLERTRSSSAA